jgi:hypothetical protein
MPAHAALVETIGRAACYARRMACTEQQQRGKSGALFLDLAQWAEQIRRLGR